MTPWQTQLDQLRKDHRTPLVLTGVVIMLLLLAIWQMVDEVIIRAPSVSVVKSTLIPPPIHLSDLHLFGVYNANLADLPTTQLPLLLEGTVMIVDNPAQSRALITESNEPATVYQIGDTVPGNATIERIEKHYVILNDNGALTKLALPIQMLPNTN